MDLQLAHSTYQALHPDAAAKFQTDHARLSAEAARAKATELIAVAKEAHSQASDNGGGMDFTRKEVTVLKGTAAEKEIRFYEMGGEIASLLIIAQNKEALDGVVDIDGNQYGRVRGEGSNAQPMVAVSNRPSDILAASLGGEENMSEQVKAGKLVFDSPEASWDFQKSMLQGANEIQTVGGTATASESVRRPGWRPDVFQLPTVFEQLPQETINQAALVYMQESVASGKPTKTGDAVGTAEGAASGQVSMQLTEQTVTARRIPAHAIVSKIALEDVSQIRRLIDVRLPQAIQFAVEGYLFSDDAGTGNNPQGLDSAVTGTTALSLSTTAHATAVINTATVVAEVMGVVFNVLTETSNQNRPNVLWAHPDLVKALFGASTSNFGQIVPAVRGLQLPAFAAYGMGITMTTRISPLRAGSAGTRTIGVVGDTSEIALVVRRQPEIEVGLMANQLSEGRVTYYADMRANFAYYRPAAWNRITATTV